MRKTNLFGATFLALTASAWSLTAVAQTAAPAPAPAAPTEAPAAPAEAPVATPAPDAGSPAATDTAAPASSSPKMHSMHHKSMHGHGKLAPTAAGNRAVEDLNAASLDAAKTGKPFVAPTTPAAAKMTAHEGDHAIHAHHHHHMAKPKADAPAADAPAGDAGSK